MEEDKDLAELRARFEAWVSDDPYGRNVARFPDDGTSAWPGVYKDFGVDLAWHAFEQAAKEARDGVASKLIDTWRDNHNGGAAPWKVAVDITTIIHHLSDAERQRLLALDKEGA